MDRPPPAVGDPSPAWPLAGTTSRKVSDDIGKCRPVKACKSGHGTRHHAGEDLSAPRGTVILAPEAGEVVVVRPSWYEGTGLVLLQSDSGPVFNLGEIEPGSEAEFGIAVGSRVLKSQPLARVGRHKMLHFEAYVEGTRATSQWPIGEPPPPSLLDPVPYLALASGRPKPPTPTPDPTPPTNPNYPTNPQAPGDTGGGGALLAGAITVAVLGVGAVIWSRR